MRYFDYPLEQGLRLVVTSRLFSLAEYFDYPLEQGLRPLANSFTFSKKMCILIIH